MHVTVFPSHSLDLPLRCQSATTRAIDSRVCCYTHTGTQALQHDAHKQRASKAMLRTYTRARNKIHDAESATTTTAMSRCGTTTRAYTAKSSLVMSSLLDIHTPAVVAFGGVSAFSTHLCNFAFSERNTTFHVCTLLLRSHNTIHGVVVAAASSSLTVSFFVLFFWRFVLSFFVFIAHFVARMYCVRTLYTCIWVFFL